MLHRTHAWMAAATLFVAACAAGAARGKVVTIDERAARVRIDAADLREGDMVQFRRDTCGTPTRGWSGSPNCKLTPIGKGVVRRADATEAEVQADPGVVIRQGDAVERLPR